jgi:hypothetical protein
VRLGTVAHTCNPRYSGSRDQEDHSSKPTQASHLRDPISRQTFTRRAGGVVQVVGPEFKPQNGKKKKKKKEERRKKSRDKRQNI